MANAGFYWFTDPDVIAQKFSVFSEKLGPKLGIAVSRALDVATEDMRATILGLPRIRTGKMFSSIDSHMGVTGGGRVAGRFGYIDDPPFYTIFQEYGTRYIEAAHAFTSANQKLYVTLKTSIDEVDIWSDLRF